MPLLYSYKNADTDPDKLWKIKRRVAKSLRMANEDDRGLTETSDMSDEVDNLFDKLQQLLDKVIYIGNYFLSEINKIGRKVITFPEFNFTLISRFLIELNKIDINKMNASNVELLKSKTGQLDEYRNSLSNILDQNKQRYLDPNSPEVLSPRKQQNLNEVIGFYEQILIDLEDLISRLGLKLLNYRQTSAVLREEGVEPLDMFGSGMRGGCCCDARLEYYPQYQNKMFY
jgi:hypothetical protein